jgi:tRNA (guanine-N7-)-methyltransferase
VGKDRSGAGTEVSLRALKPPPERLYGRRSGHKLRPRQQLLLDVALPRLALRLSGGVGAPLPPAGGEWQERSERAPPIRAGTPACLPQDKGGHSSPPLPSPLWLEIGFGAGEHALAQIAAHPDATLIACEVFENGICSLLSRLVPEGAEADAPLPPNLRLWTADARILLRALPDASLERLFLLFPDPWPKARHAKRRFVHPAALPLLARVLNRGAEWRVASDDPTYQAWVDDVMAAQNLFSTEPPVIERPSDWPPTRYEAKALRAGRTPHYWTFRRKA